MQSTKLEIKCKTSLIRASSRLNLICSCSAVYGMALCCIMRQQSVLDIRSIVLMVVWWLVSSYLAGYYLFLPVIVSFDTVHTLVLTLIQYCWSAAVKGSIFVRWPVLHAVDLVCPVELSWVHPYKMSSSIFLTVF